MNVIIANRYQAMLQTLDIDVIKRMEGEFDVDEIISTFQNFFFQRMILDITAIKNYKNIETLQKLATSLDMEKVILLLDDSAESSSTQYLSKLISLGIYNFTKNVEGIMYLYNNPNSYRDVAQYHQLNDIREVVVEKFGPSVGAKILGIVNVNKSAGATTLTYMMKKQLSKNYSVGAIEVDKRDFMYFKDKDMVSCTNEQLGNTVAKFSDKDVILIDMNTSQAAKSICHEIIYLIEPSVIKLNRMMMVNPRALANLKNNKVVLNQSLLTNRDMLEFQAEAGIKIFYNMPPLDEREKDISGLDPFLLKLGFERQAGGENEKKNRILGLFGK